jgi:FkbM family methyltransferase
MKLFLKKIVNTIPSGPLLRLFRFKFRDAAISYSQNGEDIIFGHFFGNRSTGIYVDIGAHDPRRFSNTHLLYQKGWSGINIDPTPGMKNVFAERTRDTNLEVGISDQTGNLKYYVYNKGTLNTFDETVVVKHAAENISPIQTIEVPVTKLADVLNTHLKSGVIDLLCIDVEGHEINVLRSSDWEKFRPSIIAIEDHALNLENLSASPIYVFLKNKGYTLFTHANYTSMYRTV